MNSVDLVLRKVIPKIVIAEPEKTAADLYVQVSTDERIGNGNSQRDQEGRLRRKIPREILQLYRYWLR